MTAIKSCFRLSESALPESALQIVLIFFLKQSRLTSTILMSDRLGYDEYQDGFEGDMDVKG